MHDASPGPPTIWTIGHSNHPLEAFLDLLATHRIDLLIDVRFSPYSRYASQFNRETIDPCFSNGRFTICTSATSWADAPRTRASSNT